MEIAVARISYAELSNSQLLAQHNEVKALDIVEEKFESPNEEQSPIEDTEVSDFLPNDSLTFIATLNAFSVYSHSDFIIFTPPIDYDS